MLMVRGSGLVPYHRGFGGLRGFRSSIPDDTAVLVGPS